MKFVESFSSLLTCLELSRPVKLSKDQFVLLDFRIERISLLESLKTREGLYCELSTLFSSAGLSLVEFGEL